MADMIKATRLENFETLVRHFRQVVSDHPTSAAIAAHVVLACFLFSDFIFGFKLGVHSYDNYHYQFPSVLFSKRYFMDGLMFPWNAFLQAGVDFSASNYSYMYSPVLWPVFIFPDEYFFPALTALHFLMTVACGVFAYLFFREETADPKWSFIGSVAYQIGGSFFFSLNVYPLFVGYVLSIIAAYVIWTIHLRRAYLSVIYLTICLSAIWLGNHIIQAGMIGILICILFLYRSLKKFGGPFRLNHANLVFYLGLVSSLLIGMVKLLPLFLDVGSSDRLTTVPYLLATDIQSNSPYYLMSAFFPEFFGVKFSMPSPLGDGKIVQYAYDLSYIGIFPMLLSLYAILRKGARPIFWIIFFIGSLIFLFKMKPFSDLALFFLYPAFHDFMLKVFFPIPFCALVAYGGKCLEQDFFSEAPLPKWSERCLYIPFALAIIFAAILFYENLNTHLIEVKVFILVFSGSVLALALTSVENKIVAFKVLIPALLSVGVAAPVVAFLMGTTLTTGAATKVVLLDLLSLFTVCVAWILIGIEANQGRYSLFKPWLYAVLAVAFILLLIPYRSFGDLPGTSDTVYLDLVSIFRFILFSFVLFYLLSLAAVKKIAISFFFPLVILVTSADLLSYGKWYGDLISPGFWKSKSILYPTNLKGLFMNKMGQSGKTSADLLKNGSFEGDDPQSGWTRSGWDIAVDTITTDPVCGRQSLRVQSRDSRGILFQDVMNSSLEIGDEVMAGAWVKSSQPGSVRLYLTNQKHGRWSQFHSGSGKWEWLSVRLTALDAGVPFRLHSWGEPRSVYQIDAAALVMGGELTPLTACSGQKVSPAFADHGEKPQTIDIKKFRVAEPSPVFGFGPRDRSYITHIPYIYGVRSFGGGTGFRPKYFSKLYFFFADPGEVDHAGLTRDNVTNPRFLDLFGVGYEFDEKTGKTVQRPGSLSRIMFFENHEVIPDDDRALERLAEDSFVPRSRLVLAEAPGFSASENAGAGRDIGFTEVNANEIVVTVSNDKPGVVLFGDIYNEGWRAYADGVQTPLIRANVGFMAFPVGAGTREIRLVFSSTTKPLRLLFVFLGILLAAGATLWFFRRRETPVIPSLT